MSQDNKQIFVVDDDESVCRALSILLGTYGFSVKTFICAEDFFKSVPAGDPGCLLLDIHMPGLDGWETLERLVKSGCRRPVIIISAERNGRLSERVLKGGAAGFLQKPFSDQALLDLIRGAFKE
jgi:two-component system, LuxR family, response regulator FixJ